VPALPAGSIIPPEIQKRAIEPHELTCGHVSALAIFGPENYAYRLGLIGAPSRICQALAPLAFGLLIEPMGRLVVAVSAGLSPRRSCRAAGIAPIKHDCDSSAEEGKRAERCRGRIEWHGRTVAAAEVECPAWRSA
jgi:hypothetical protein